jgi:hypothetical protein
MGLHGLLTEIALPLPFTSYLLIGHGDVLLFGFQAFSSNTPAVSVDKLILIYIFTVLQYLSYV